MSAFLRFLAILAFSVLLNQCGDATFRGNFSGEGSKGKEATGPNSSEANPDELAAECAKTGTVPAGVLDFEDDSQQDSRIDFWASHGIRFFADNNHSLKRVKTTRVGDSNPPADQRAWLCIKCVGSPNYNRLADAASEDRVKQYALANTSALHTRSSGFRIEFKDPPSKVSFDLIDVDGGEQWNFIVTDADGEVIPDAVINGYKSSGYNINTSDNGRYKTFGIQSASGKIAKISIEGKKNSAAFGFALDNIDAGFNRCKNLE